MRECLVYRLPMAHPGDVSQLARLLDSGELTADQIAAVFGKTEGNGCVNDFTRAYAVSAFQALLSARSPRPTGAALVMSGGTEGGLSPHMLVLATRQLTMRPTPGAALDASNAASKRLAIGTAFTADFDASEIGRMPQVDATASAVKQAMANAGIDDIRDVHFVQIKCPLLTSERIAEAVRQGKTVSTHDTYESMGLSRGASALGVGVALGEIDRVLVTDASVGHDLSLWSGRASASAGIELMNNEVIVLGNSSAWGGGLRIGHGVMKDAIDLPAVIGVVRQLGLTIDGQLSAADSATVVAALVKADPSRSGQIRGKRHIMWDDSDINATRHARAIVGGVVGAAMGTTELFVSGGAEHQGPDGGGPLAVIVRHTG